MKCRYACSVALMFLLTACSQDKEASPAAHSASQPVVNPLLEEGKAIVKANCFVCHAQGINGAPIIGNARMWGDRPAQGIDTLVQHAMTGYGLMPAKGGNESLTEKDLQLAISYMLSQLPKPE